ncbi:MAG: hypothetical protein U1F70_05795 [Candidatus Competibacteraceae bacterium]
MLAIQPAQNRTFTATPIGESPVNAMQDDLLSEYDFDYSQAQPNRFGGRAAVVVTLRPEVPTYLEARATAKGLPLGDMVNDMLKKDIELIEAVK